MLIAIVGLLGSIFADFGFCLSRAGHAVSTVPLLLFFAVVDVDVAGDVGATILK